jgi:hypothetical protein
MILVPECIDAGTVNGGIAGVALWAEELSVVFLAIWQSFKLHKGLAFELDTAVVTAKMLGMPHLTSSFNVIL